MMMHHIELTYNCVRLFDDDDDGQEETFKLQ